MNRITQEAHKRQAIVKFARKKGKTHASRMYGVSLSSVKRWCKRYDWNWQSLKERSHRPKRHPMQHTGDEEEIIREAVRSSFFRYGWEGAYMAAKEVGYSRSYSGFIYAAKRMGLCGGKQKTQIPRKNERRYPNFLFREKKYRWMLRKCPTTVLEVLQKEMESAFISGQPLTNAPGYGLSIDLKNIHRKIP